MASQRTLHRPGLDRRLLYAILAALIVVPVLIFALGPLASDSFSVEGPAGPLLAFSAGVLSFVSPCVLPIVPVFVAHLSGATVEGGHVSTNRRTTFTHALAFVAGLSLVFIVLGTSVGLLGSYVLQDNQRDLERGAGLMLVVMGVLLIPSHGRRSPIGVAAALLVLAGAYFFIASVADLRGDADRAPDRTGLVMLGAVLVIAWLRFSGYLPLSFFSRTFELNVARNRGVGYTRSALIGGAFALGWTPCIGPILASILALTARETATTGDVVTGTYLLVAYSAGLSLPFVITGLAFSDATSFFRKVQRFTPAIEMVSAVVLIAIGLLLWYGRLTGLNELFDFAGFNQGL